MSAAEIQNCIESPVHVLQTVGQTVRDFPVKKVVVAERGCRAVAVSAHGGSIEENTFVGHVWNISGFTDAEQCVGRLICYRLRYVD